MRRAPCIIRGSASRPGHDPGTGAAPVATEPAGATARPPPTPMRHAESVDVAIVGAGPAGAITALLLARAGHHILLLDRRTFPRPKPCGDCLSAGATPLLRRVGALADVEAEHPARLAGWRVVAPGGSSFHASFAPAAHRDPDLATALALPRDRLDHALLRAATREGARLHTGFRVTDLLRDPHGRIVGVVGRDSDGAPFAFATRLVVGADGLRSTIARRLGLIRRAPRLRKLSLSTHLHGLAEPIDHGELHLADGACLGIAPVLAADAADAPLHNLTLVVDARRFARSVAAGARAFLRDALRRFPGLAPRLDATIHTLAAEHPPILASGPFDWPTRDIVAHGAALVGDAAGYFDPFTGQGIFQALAGALALAESADDALRAGHPIVPPLRPYARRHARIVRGARAVQRAIDFVTSRPSLADRAIRRLADAPATATTLVAVTGDILPARSLLSPSAILALLFGLSPPEVPR